MAKRTPSFKTKPLKDLCAAIIDCPHSTPPWLESGKLVLRNFNIRNGQIDLTSPSYTDENTFNQRNTRVKPESGDLVISREAPMGEVAMIPEGLECCLGQRMVLLRPEQEICDPRYLLYAMLSEYVQTQIRRNDTSGSIVSNLCIPDLAALMIPYYDLDTQRRIGATLSLIDNKIANNKKLMIELETTAQLIYDYWFTQYDFPDECGKPYHHSGGKMAWSNELKRAIPESWRIVPVKDACSIVDCLHSKKPDEQFEREDAYLLQLDNLVDLGMLDLSWKYHVAISDYEEWTSRIQLNDGDMVITNAGRVGGMARIGEGVVTGMGRNMTGIRPVSVPAMFMWYFFQSPEMKRQISNNTDSGSFFGSLNVAGIKSLMFVLPPSKSMGLLDQFSNHVEPLRRQAEALQQENHELMNLRDWILPILMNEQATVGE